MILNSLKQKACYQNGQNQISDINEAKKLIYDIEVDINKVKATKEDKKAFNDLNKLINDINNNKVNKEDAVEN